MSGTGHATGGVTSGMGHFQAQTHREHDRVRVALTGECDLAVRDELHAALHAAVGVAPLVVVDLAALAFLDSSGVHNLVMAHHAARDRGGRVVVVNATGAVAAVLDVTGVGVLLAPAVGDCAGPAAGRGAAG